MAECEKCKAPIIFGPKGETEYYLPVYHKFIQADYERMRQEKDRLTEEVKKMEQWVDDLQSGMYISCTYCGHRYGPNDGQNHVITMREALHKHVEQCPKHPMSELKKECERLQAAFDRCTCRPLVVREFNSKLG